MGTETISKKDIALLLIKKATEIQGVGTTGIVGKKALQKSIYFFNQKRKIFFFKWGDYGPISPEVQQIYEDLASSGSIIVEEIPTQKVDAVIYNMKFSPENNPYFSEIVFPESIEHTLDKVIDFIKGRSPRELELLASVHYWAVKQQSVLDEYTIEYVLDKLTEYKPDAGFKGPDVIRAIKTLEDAGYLSRNI